MKLNVAAILVALVSCAASNAQVADVVYTGGKIYTVDEDEPWAEAVAIKDGKFIKVSSSDNVKAVTGNDTKVVDLGGKFVMPGLVDTHTHPFDSSFQILDELVLHNPQSPEDIQKQVAAYAAAHPEKEWITGLAWPKGMFAGENPQQVSVWRKRWRDDWQRLISVECNESRSVLKKEIEKLLADAPRKGREPRFSPEQQAAIVAIACENPDKESERPISQFTVREIADEAVKRDIVPSISRTQVWTFLKSDRRPATSK